jgi:hypothetical protein
MLAAPMLAAPMLAALTFAALTFAALTFAALTFATMLLASPAAAQDPRPAVTAGGQPCTYDSCVLRVEETWFGRRIVRGQEGTLVARLGLGGPSLTNVVIGSDSAIHHARLYDRAQTTGSVLTLIGTLGSIASFIAYTQRDPEDDLRSEIVAVNIGALVLGVVGTTFQYRARRELSRSLWWYNREALGNR